MDCGNNRNRARLSAISWIWLSLRIVLLAFTVIPSPAKAGCLTLASGPIVFDVAGCKLIDPEKDFDTTKEKFRFINDLDPAGRKAFIDSYRGLFLKGKVVKSNATSRGISAESNVLDGMDVFLFIPPPLKNACDAVWGKRLAGNLRQICCDGGGDIPCLLETEYLLTGSDVVGSASSGAGDAQRQRAKRSKPVQDGDKAFGAKRYKDAIKNYEIARGNGDLDVGGLYKLGYAYREIDQCRDAIGPLKVIQDMSAKKKIWADQEKIARSAILLLARCYAKMNDPGPAVLILNGYLLESDKYSFELKESLRHKDFGWIHTSREYREYKKAAEKKVKK